MLCVIITKVIFVRKEWLQMKYIKVFLTFIMSVLMMTSCAYESYDLSETYAVVTEVSQTSETSEETSEAYSEETTVSESDITEISVEKDGSYTSPDDVAEYIHNFGTLPDNFMTKSEAQDLGWNGGDLWKYADGMSIGGDRFGNYEGRLPEADGRTYNECDVNYSGGSRGAERIVFSNDGLIFYTDDHYETFTQMY